MPSKTDKNTIHKDMEHTKPSNKKFHKINLWLGKIGNFLNTKQVSNYK